MKRRIRNGRPAPSPRPAARTASSPWRADPAAGRAATGDTPPQASQETRYVRLTSSNFQWLHQRTVDLLRSQGDGHLTTRAVRVYTRLEPEDTERPGSFILAALDATGRVIAVTAALRWGHDLSLVAVHRRHRGRGLAGTLLRLAVRALGRYYAEVAADNLPSLRAFFACGLQAYDVFTRPSGKVVLRLRTVEPLPPMARPETPMQEDTGGE